MPTKSKVSAQMGLGIDLEKPSRFANYKKDNVFLKSVFTSREISYCFSKKTPAENLASRYAGKEAVIKALSDLDDKNVFNPKDYAKIEITNDAKGVPKVSIKALSVHGVSVKISLTHTSDVAAAIALAIKK